MAKRTKEEESEAEEKSSPSAAASSVSRDEDEAPESDPAGESSEDTSEEDDASDEEASDEEPSDEEASDEDDDSSDEDDADEEPKAASKSAASTSDEASTDDDSDETEEERAAREAEEEEGVLPTQLGTQRYIFAAYFVGGMLMAYVIGRAVHGIWSHYSNRDFFVSAVPQLAAIPDESKQTYSTVFAAVVSLLFVLRTARKPDVRKWTEEVTTEITKVKWPTRKEVTNSTIVVITASALATTYLFLLDRLWSFVTGLVYGAGT